MQGFIPYLFALVLMAFAICNASAQATTGEILQCESGIAAFDSATNMPGIEVSGKSSALSVSVEVSQTEGRLKLHHIAAVLPVKTLTTGMKVRDEHMRKYIFRTSEGQEPDIRFDAEESACEAPAAGRDFECQIAGSMSIRGVVRPFAMRLHVKDENGDRQRFRAIGDATVKLSAYGIPQPSQFGVKPADEVKIKVDFTARAKQATASVSAAGGVR